MRVHEFLMCITIVRPNHSTFEEAQASTACPFFSRRWRQWCQPSTTAHSSSTAKEARLHLVAFGSDTISHMRVQQNVADVGDVRATSLCV